MKDLKKMKTLLTALLVFFAAQLVAGNPLAPNIEIAKVGVSKKIKVTIGNLKADAEISISDLAGTTLISETIDKNSFGKLYNLELLPKGTYVVTVQTGLREVEQPLSIDKYDINIDVRKRRETLLPFVKLDQKIVNVMMLNKRITDVTVKIIDKNGELLFTDAIGNVVKVEKSYNLAALDRGTYQVIIETPNRTFYREVFND